MRPSALFLGAVTRAHIEQDFPLRGCPQLEPLVRGQRSGSEFLGIRFRIAVQARDQISAKARMREPLTAVPEAVCPSHAVKIRAVVRIDDVNSDGTGQLIVLPR